MPSTLPTLIWDFGAPQALSTPTSIDDLMNAIDAAVTASTTGWRVLDKKLSSDPSPWNGGASVGILIGGPVGSAVEDARILLVTSSDGAEVIDTAVSGTLAPVGNNQAASLWVTYSPDAGANGFSAFGSGATDVSDGEFLTSGPGAAEQAFKGQRETGFSSLFATPATTGVTNVSLWSTTEMFLLIPLQGTAPRGVLAGATVVPPSDKAAEVDGRVHGMHISPPLGNSNNQWLGGTTFTGTGSLKAYVFRPNTPAAVDLVYVTTRGNQRNSANQSDTPSGPKMAWPCILEQRYSSKQQFGWARQIGAYDTAIHGANVLDKDGTVVGRVFGQSTSGANNAWAVTNLGNQGG